MVGLRASLFLLFYLFCRLSIGGSQDGRSKTRSKTALVSSEIRIALAVDSKSAKDALIVAASVINSVGSTA